MEQGKQLAEESGFAEAGRGDRELELRSPGKRKGRFLMHFRTFIISLLKAKQYLMPT